MPFKKEGDKKVTKGKLIFSGKSKDEYETDDPNQNIIEYKDEVNPQKTDLFEGKGIIINEIATIIFLLLMQKGIKTIFISRLNERESLVKRVTPMPINIMVRNMVSDAFSERYGIEKGSVLPIPVLEMYLANDELGNPMLNEHHAIAFGIINKDKLSAVRQTALKINDILLEVFNKMGMKPVEFSLKFGVDSNDELVLSRELSPENILLLYENDESFIRSENSYKNLLRKLKGE